MLTFEPFPKIGRLKRACTITEKIDGTNAQIVFDAEGAMLVGSRKREILPEGVGEKGCDNFGFASWCFAHRDDLFSFLGEGRHYGEWAGGSIQCGYGMDEKRFFLFNTGRFGPGKQSIPTVLEKAGLDVVPVLYEGPYTTVAVDECMRMLEINGSRINHYDKPEGVIIWHHALRHYSKVTFEHDGGKGPDRQSPA